MERKHYSKGSNPPHLEPGKLRLYAMRFCPFAQRAMLVLNAKNITCEVVNINLYNKPEWYVEKYPPGKVPVLEQDDRFLCESLVIAEYLDEAYPENKLSFSDPYQRARDKMLLEGIGQIGLSLKNMGGDNSDNRVEEWHSLQQTHVAKFEKELENRGTPFFGGSRPGMFDFMIYPFFEKIRVFLYICPEVPSLSADKFPKITAWMHLMKEDSAVKNSLPNIEFHAEYFKSHCNNQVPNYDVGL